LKTGGASNAFVGSSPTASAECRFFSVP